jgi:hypothetical protein
MIVTRSLTANEPDLLIGNEAVKLFIRDLSGDALAEYSAPVDGWTHDKLEALERDTFFATYPDGWDAFLGECWVGSSEI